MRQLHWPVPRKILGVVPFQWGTYSRLGHFLLPMHWRAARALRPWHRRLAGVKRFVWWLLERIFAAQFGLRSVPTTVMEHDLFGGGQILTNEFWTAVDSGRIRVCDEQATMEGDLVVCATGFKKSYSMFDPDTRGRLDVCDDGLWLYMNTVPPKVPRLAFVGSEVSTYNNILTHHLQSEWLVHMLRTDALPSQHAMEEHVERERAWKRSWMPWSPSRSAQIQLHMTQLHDDLCRGMGKRLPRTKWYEWIFPLTARDYA